MFRSFSRWKLAGLVLAILVGIAGGVGAYTFVYAKGSSYMTNDPAACANCHIMQAYYDAWRKASHHAVAVCNDCHTPASFVPKYLVKAKNGWNHSYAFTSGDFPDPLQITESNREIVEAQCRRCHQEMAAAVDGHAEALPCARCHGSVGHMR